MTAHEITTRLPAATSQAIAVDIKSDQHYYTPVNSAMPSVTAAASPHGLSAQIDELLEQYLGLLDQYTTLRTQLSSVQCSIHQNIARANFNADRGIRYGADCYDERMQATRTCRVTPIGDMKADTVLFDVSKASKPDEDPKEEDVRSKGTGDSAEADPAEKVEAKHITAESTKVKDPMRMFGILVPQPLRIAQGSAVKMVEDLIPRIASVDAKMRETEIEIRRKRKYRAKAEALEMKVSTDGLEAGKAVECSN